MIYEVELQDVYSNVVLEENKKQSLSWLHSKGIPEEVIKKIIQLDVTPSKGHSIQLGKYYLETNSIGPISDYYKKFAKLYEKNKSLQITKYKTFHDFENFIDANERSHGKINTKGEKTSSEVRSEAIYEDENVEIYYASNVKSACDYGHKLGQSYSFCISRTGSGNLYNAYRLRQQSSMYFIKSKHRSSNIVDGRYEDPSHMIVLDVMPDPYNSSEIKLQWTWADNGSQGHGTKETTWEEVFEEVPELQVPYEKGVFESHPLSPEERSKLETFNAINEGDFESFHELDYDEKDEYLKSGFTIDDSIFNSLDKEQRNEFLGTGGEISEGMYESLSPVELKRWSEVRLRVIEAML